MRHCRLSGRGCYLLLWILTLSAASAAVVGCDGDASDADAGDVAVDRIVHVTLLQTTDMHHHASGNGAQGDYTPLDTGDSDPVTGGYARLAAVINAIRAEQEQADIPVLLVDSGDFMMGTIYDMTAEDPLAFKFLQVLDYDVVTLGNHEFEWGPSGLDALLTSAVNATPAFQVPIVATNMVTDPEAPEDDAIEEWVRDGIISDRRVIELGNGLVIGFIGLMGENADDDAATAPPITFSHDAELVQSAVDALRQSGAHLVVALSHSGIDADLTDGEDFDLAQDVTGIDVIASGHSHLPTPDMLTAGSTLIMQPGQYGEWLARLDIEFNLTQGRVESHEFELIPIDDSIEGDTAIEELVDDADDQIDALLEDALDIHVDTPVVGLAFELPRLPMVETGLGNLAADAMRTSATLAVQQSADPTPFAMSVVPNGILRSELFADSEEIVRFAEVYHVHPNGMSPDPSNQDIPGWPLISVYATATEMLHVCEITVTGAWILGNRVYCNLGGLRCEYEPRGEVFHRAKRVFLCGNALPTALGGDGDTYSTDCDVELDLEDETTLYRGVVDLYTLLMLSIVPEVMSIVPKYADGTPIDLSDPADYLMTRLDVDPTTDGVQELKAWVSLWQFLKDLPDAGGDPSLPDIPEDVYGTEGSGMGRMIAIEAE